MADLTRLCIHTITTKPWRLEEALQEYRSNGVGGVSIWQNALEEMGPERASHLVTQSGVKAVSYVRGGFFPSVEPEKRAEVIEHNK
ncbi:MAG: sugar phosphate isomerase/epimerase, partial [Saprospiraceae bacterium]|nr:sugar phosphate isomerase/epimerase [Saprospiraceae bacterium]